MVSTQRIRPETYFTPGVSGDPQDATVFLEKSNIYRILYYKKKFCFLNTNHNNFIPLTVSYSEKTSEYNFVGKIYI